LPCGEVFKNIHQKCEEKRLFAKEFQYFVMRNAKCHNLFQSDWLSYAITFPESSFVCQRRVKEKYNSVDALGQQGDELIEACGFM